MEDQKLSLIQERFTELREDMYPQRERLNKVAHLAIEGMKYQVKTPEVSRERMKRLPINE